MPTLGWESSSEDMAQTITEVFIDCIGLFFVTTTNTAVFKKSMNIGPP